MRLIRYKSEFQEPMLVLHRSAIEGFTLGMSQQQDEADLLAIEEVYLRNRGEFLLGFVGARFVAMGGFKRLSDGLAELVNVMPTRVLHRRGPRAAGWQFGSHGGAALGELTLWPESLSAFGHRRSNAMKCGS